MKEAGTLIRPSLVRAVCAGLLIAALPAVVSGQSTWLPFAEESSVSLEAFKADRALGSAETFTSSVWFLTRRGRVNTAAMLVAELPLSHFDLKYSTDAENTAGNPYIGLLFNSRSSTVIGEAGVRIPATPMISMARE